MTDSISTYDQWKADRPLIIGSLIYAIVISVILFYTIYAYFNMQHINGRVASVDVDRQKHTYLTLKLIGDKRIYYQVYGKRFMTRQSKIFIKMVALHYTRLILLKKSMLRLVVQVTSQVFYIILYLISINKVPEY